MLAEGRRRWERFGGKQAILLQQADLRDWHIDEGHFDLVVTNFFLDCFSPEELPRSCKWASTMRSSRDATYRPKQPSSVAPC